MLKKRVFISFIVLLFIIAYKKFNSCSDHQVGYKVGLKEITYHDKIRERELNIAIWYPTSNNQKNQCMHQSIWEIGEIAQNAEILNSSLKYPLIMFSHGFGLDQWASSWFAKYLASQGYIVITIDHYGNTTDNMIAKWSIRPFERARDISFVLDKLLQDNYWSKLIDTNKIGAAGYSQGGAGVLWLAGARAHYTNMLEDYKHENEHEKNTLRKLFKDQKAYEDALRDFDYNLANSSFKDKRIKAVFAMAPGIDETFVYFNNFKDIDIPVFIVTGDHDDIINPKQNAQYYAAQIKNAQIKTAVPGVAISEAWVPGATHWTFLNEETLLGRIVEPSVIHDNAIKDRVKDHEIIGKLALEFFDKNL